MHFHSVYNTFICLIFADPLLLEVEAEEMRQKLDSVVEKQTYIERTQQEILRTQNAILSRLDVVEKSLRPQMQSTPHRYARPRFESTSPSWQRQQWLDDDYGTEWNSMVYPLQQFPDISHCYQPDPTYADISHHYQPDPTYTNASDRYQPDPPHRKSLHPTNHQSLEHPQENSSYSPEPFGIKFGENILPSSEIPRAGLVPAEHILQKFSRLRCESKVGTLAVKLAREAIFGDKVLIRCTVMGERELPGLPATELMELKRMLFKQFPQLWAARHEFEPLWKVCVEAIGQACKRLRIKKSSTSM